METTSIPRDILVNPELTAGEKIVLIVILDATERQERPDKAELARRCGLSESTLKRVLAPLVKRELLEMEPGRGRGRVSGYNVIYPRSLLHDAISAASHANEGASVATSTPSAGRSYPPRRTTPRHTPIAEEHVTRAAQNAVVRNARQPAAPFTAATPRNKASHPSTARTRAASANSVPITLYSTDASTIALVRATAKKQHCAVTVAAEIQPTVPANRDLALVDLSLEHAEDILANLRANRNAHLVAVLQANPFGFSQLQDFAIDAIGQLPLSEEQLQVLIAGARARLHPEPFRWPV